LALRDARANQLSRARFCISRSSLSAATAIHSFLSHHADDEELSALVETFAF
jgi:hypothetical protein